MKDHYQIPASSSDEISTQYDFYKNTDKVLDPYALAVDCHKGTMYENTCSLIQCKFTDCKGDGYVHGDSLVDSCEACSSHAESYDVGN